MTEDITVRLSLSDGNSITGGVDAEDAVELREQLQQCQFMEVRRKGSHQPTLVNTSHVVTAKFLDKGSGAIIRTGSR